MILFDMPLELLPVYWPRTSFRVIKFHNLWSWFCVRLTTTVQPHLLVVAMLMVLGFKWPLPELQLSWAVFQEEERKRERGRERNFWRKRERNERTKSRQCHAHRPRPLQSLISLLEKRTLTAAALYELFFPALRHVFPNRKTRSWHKAALIPLSSEGTFESSFHDWEICYRVPQITALLQCGQNMYNVIRRIKDKGLRYLFYVMLFAN